MKKNRIICLILIISIALIILDQTSKAVIKYNYKKPVETKIVTIELIQNEGIAFGINAGNSKNIALTLVVLLIVINFVVKEKEKINIPNAIAVSLIFAGGFSNLIDRIFRGGVIDFIKITKFAIFNIADCYIVLGWVMLVVFLIKELFQKPVDKNK